MNFIHAEEGHASEVLRIVETTVKEIYPNYYPAEVVQFFLNQHSLENILRDIRAGNTYLLYGEKQGQYLATGTIERRHLTRIFVLPGCQRKGYGAMVMDFLEQEAGKVYKDAMVEASLPGCIFYEKRGYQTVKHYSEEVGGGRVLVYGLMRKKLR